MSSNKTSPSLLLLPAPPTPSTRASLSAAYEPPLTAVLTKLRASSADQLSPLVIGLTCPILRGPSANAKTLCWKTAQALLAGLYTVVAAVCAREGIATDVGAGVDVRVVLVDHDRKRTYYPGFDGGFGANCTPVLDLAAFATKVRPWKTVYHINSEEGYELLSTFLKFAEGKQPILQQQLVVVEGGITLTTQDQPSREEVQGYGTVCLGGTFDHLHPGHKLLLHASTLLLKIPPSESGQTCELIVGISGDELLVNKKYAQELQPWPQRAANVLSFLHSLLDYITTGTPATTSYPDELVATLRDGTVHVRCVNIHDAFGPTVTQEAVDAICVSRETRSGGQAINEKRVTKGWRELDVYEIDVLDAREETGITTEDFSAKISSTAIRQARAEARGTIAS